MEQIKGFKNSYILTENGLEKTNLLIENGLIKRIGSFECDGLIELSDDMVIVPGFIDQHTHGAAGNDVMDGTTDALETMATALAMEGTTAFLATTAMQSPKDIEKSLCVVKEYMEAAHKTGAEIIGVHLEGPFISCAYSGALLAEYLEAPSVEAFKRYEKASVNNIKLVTMAVEEDGADALIEYLVSKDIVVSIGHTNSNYKDVEKAVKAGATCVTHTFNAQKPIHHREVGTAGSALLFDELYCEAICDGIHLSPPAIKLLWKNKPADKMVLVTDSLRAKFMPDGEYIEAGNQKVIVKNGAGRLEDGTLAGSTAKMNEAVSNVMEFVGVDLAAAVKLASENPAKNLGVFDRMGSIKEGKLANFVIVDKDVNVYQTIRNGKVIYSK